MAAPGWKQGGMSNRITRTTVSGDAVPGIPGSMLNIEMRLDQLSKKMDACLEEVRGMTRKERRSSRHNIAMPILTPQRLQQHRLETEGEGPGARTSLVSSNSEAVAVPKIGYRNVDIHSAYKEAAKDISQEMDLQSVDGRRSQPVLRLVRRTRLDMIWETLDDPNSSKKAWWISQLQSCLVMATIVVGTLEVAEEQILDPVTFAILETCFDSIFLLEFIFRIVSAPSRTSYLLDPMNFADIMCVLGLPLRASIGFVFVPDPQGWHEVAQIMLMFFLPLFRFLKLLRYFEITRLLIDACAKSAEAVPVLSYMMALIVLVSATLIYLFEERSNIPSMPHSLWLAVVTMTTVGYGDYYPTSIGGYITVSVLTFISVVFLALPVGIVGHEFNKSWQSRGHMLLMTRVRKCLSKWGFNAGDVQILIQYADTDGDGKLTLSEFVELIRQMRIGVSTEAAAELFTMLDVDFNGYVDDDEFLRNVFPDEYIKELQRAQRQALPECKKQITMALSRLDSLRSAATVVDPHNRSPIPSTDSSREQEKPTDDEQHDELFHEPM